MFLFVVVVVLVVVVGLVPFTYIHTYINYLAMQVYLKATNVDVDLQLQTKISLITFF